MAPRCPFACDVGRMIKRLWGCAGQVLAAAKSRLPPQLTHLMKQPGSDTFPLAQQQLLGRAAQAITNPAVRLGDFSVGDQKTVSLLAVGSRQSTQSRHQVTAISIKFKTRCSESLSKGHVTAAMNRVI